MLPLPQEKERGNGDGLGQKSGDDEQDRPPAVFGGTTTLHSGEGHTLRLLLPRQNIAG